MPESNILLGVIILNFIFWIVSSGLWYYQRRKRRNLERVMLQRRVAELEGLTQASRSIVAATNTFYDHCLVIAEEAGKIIDNRTFHIGMFIQDSSYRIQYWRVNGIEHDIPITLPFDEQTQPILTWIQQNQKPLLITDFEQSPYYTKNNPLHQDNPRSCIFVPLIDGTSVMGIIASQHPEPNQFSDHDVQLLSVLADVSAASLTRTRLFEQEGLQTRDLAAVRDISYKVNSLSSVESIVHQVVDTMHNELEFDPVMLFIIDRLTGEAVNRESSIDGFQTGELRIQEGVGIIGEAMLSKETILVNNVAEDSRYRYEVGHPLYDEAVQQTYAEIAIPLWWEDELIGVLDIQSQSEDGFSSQEELVLEALATEISGALGKARNAEIQQEWAWQTETQYQIARNISRNPDLQGKMEAISRLTALFLGTEHCGVLLWDEAQQQYIPATFFNTVLDTHQPFFEADLSLKSNKWGALSATHLTRKPYITQYPPPWIADKEPQQPYHLYPMRGLERVDQERPLIGVIFFQQTAEMEQKQLLNNLRWQETVWGMVEQSAQGIERAQLREEAAERRLLRQELDVALSIQSSLIPDGSPRIPSLKVASYWKAAREVSGDFYDFLDLRDGRWGIVIADVSGKGAPAAIFMALSRTIIRSVAFSPSRHGAGETLRRANKVILSDTASDLFVTVFYALWDKQTNILTYANGGHNPPLILRKNGRLETVGGYGFALGVIEEAPIEEQNIHLQKGDRVIFYTDGVTEAMNGTYEQFGMERFQQTIQRYRYGSPQDMITGIEKAIQKFVGNTPPSDDVTMVVFEVTE